MLDIKFIRENPKKVKQGCKKKQVDPSIVDQVLELDKKRRELIKKIEDLRKEHKDTTSQVMESSSEERTELKIAGAEEKEKIKKDEEQLKIIEKDFNELMLQIPNIPLNDVHEGKDERENKVIRKWGKISKFGFKPKDHIELGKKLDIIDTEKAAQVSGARFAYLKNEAALLEFALVKYAFDVLTSEKILKKIAKKGHSSKPFVPVIPPVIIRPEVYTKMARLSRDEEDEKYYLAKDNVYLTGSAEHTLGPIHMNEVIKDLPKRYVGFSTCFRREAGSYGKDTRGILRVHQFDKIEMESFTRPENSLNEQEFFVGIQEYLMQSLEIPYQVVMICTGDMGKPDARQIDIESWIPSQNKYRETNTADLMTDYQSRALNTKFKEKNGKTKLVHMNDATVFAIGRTLIAIIENYQQKDGSIKIPKVLQKYLNFKSISEKKSPLTGYKS